MRVCVCACVRVCVCACVRVCVCACVRTCIYYVYARARARARARAHRHTHTHLRTYAWLLAVANGQGSTASKNHLTSVDIAITLVKRFSETSWRTDVFLGVTGPRNDHRQRMTGWRRRLRVGTANWRLCGHSVFR